MTYDPKNPFGEAPDVARARRARSGSIARGLLAFLVIIFVITVVKLSANVAP